MRKKKEVTPPPVEKPEEKEESWSPIFGSDSRPFDEMIGSD